MSDLRSLGMRLVRRHERAEPELSYVVRQQPLYRVLNFTGRTIDDVVNSPIVKNEILGYYKLHKFIHRRCEVRELERQWNPTGS